MAGSHSKVLEVRFHDGRLVGWLAHGGPVYFAYDAGWLATGHNLSPLSLPFSERPFNCKAEGCEGLPGMIADSLPDAWGMKVAQAVFAREGWGRPTPVKLFAWIGRRGVGALSFHPPSEPRNEYLGRISAASLAREAGAVLRGDAKAVISALESAGSAGGAYPKALVMEHADGTLSLAKTPVKPGDKPSILKLSVPNQAGGDAATEHAYGRMAKAAGIRMASSKLIEDEHGARHLLIARFDFDVHGKRRHMHSLSGLLHRPKDGLDYADLFSAIARLGAPATCIEEAARRMVFNLYAGNDDDHGRNHAFLYDEATRQWTLSPAFDVTHSPGTLSRGMTILGEMRPGWSRVSDWLETAGLSKATIAKIRKDVLRALGRWKHFATQSGVSGRQIKTIDDGMSAIIKTTNIV